MLAETNKFALNYLTISSWRFKIMPNKKNKLPHIHIFNLCMYVCMYVRTLVDGECMVRHSYETLQQKQLYSVCLRFLHWNS